MSLCTWSKQPPPSCLFPSAHILFTNKVNSSSSSRILLPLKRPPARQKSISCFGCPLTKATTSGTPSPNFNFSLVISCFGCPLTKAKPTLLHAGVYPTKAFAALKFTELSLYIYKIILNVR